jgi:hypothetical protein
MPRGNPSPKLAITIDPDIHDKILAAARPGRVERLRLADGRSARSTANGATRAATRVSGVIYDAAVLLQRIEMTGVGGREHKARLELGVCRWLPRPSSAKSAGR